MAKVCEICKNNRGPYGRCKFYKCNGKWRHLVCWQKLCECAEFWLYGQGPQTKRQVQYALYMIEQFRKKYENQEATEREMRAVQCCSRRVYDALLATHNVGLAFVI